MASSTAKGRTVLGTDRHTLRLVQLSPTGTVTDTIMDARWAATPKRGPGQGLNGRGGFASADTVRVIGDASTFTLTLPPVGADGIANRERFYIFAGTPDTASPTAPRQAYYPGDEWVEIYRGEGELIASGTPVSTQATIDQLQIACVDVTHPFKKTRETAAGFWQANAPRDVFEHYTRLTRTIVADDFHDGVPAGFTSQNASADTGSGSAIRLTASGGDASQFGLLNTPGFPVEPYPTSQPSRVEANISQISAVPAGEIASVYFNVIGESGTVYTSFLVTSAGQVLAGSRVGSPTGAGFVNVPVLSAGTTSAAAGSLLAPYTVAVEVRNRWCYFYLNGQLVSIAAQPDWGEGENVTVQVAAGGVAGFWADVDYMVVRQGTRPLNGGQPGDYALPAPPTPGGVTAEYWDMGQPAQAMNGYGVAFGQTQGVAGFCELTGAPTVGSKVSETVETRIADPGTPLAGFQTLPTGLTAPFYIRRSGAIWLPLATQDIHFTATIPDGRLGNFPFRLYVGRTRRGEELLANFPADPAYQDQFFSNTITSAGLRSLLGNVSGWYPFVYEETSRPDGGLPPGVQITYDVDGGEPQPGVLSPLGCYRGQVADGESHYDTIRTLSEQFNFQWISEPMQLESGWFPGAIVPRARVGRDTDFILDQTQGFQPQQTLNAEDMAQTLLGQASGLGGSSTGSITAEVFDFDGMSRHPFVSQEAENLPTTNIVSQFLAYMETLLALRTSAWEDVTAVTPAQRTPQDAYPPIALPQIKEFDWQPGDGARVRIPAIGVIDTDPRQIFQLHRTIYPLGVGASQGSFRPRPRNFTQTMRRFVRQVLGDRRSFQGQLISTPGNRAVAPGYTEALLPLNTALVRDARLAVLTKDNPAAMFDLEVNGTVVQTQSVGLVGYVDLRAWVAPNLADDGSAEPRMVARLINPSDVCNVSYQLDLTVLIPAGA